MPDRASMWLNMGKVHLNDGSAALSDDAAPEKATLDAALAMLEPLAGLLLSRQMRYAQAEDLLKAAYVRASARAYAAQGVLPTVSTLSVATGIRRREVKRLLDLDALSAARPPSAAAQARLRWATDPSYLDDAGQPRRLPRNAAPGEPSFARLAATVSKDMHARALLDEMLRIGAVDEDGDFVTLRQREYAPPREEDELVRIAGANVGDHLSAVLMNLLSAPAPLLERAIHADGLTQASARHGADLARQAWRDVLGGLREKLQTLTELDEGAADNAWRMRIGMFAYFAPKDPPQPPVSAKSRPTTPKTPARKRPGRPAAGKKTPQGDA